MAQTLPGIATRPDQTLALNMKLVSHHELQGFGGIGEGMGMQLARDGRRILWLAHESAPKNFTGVDDPYEAPEQPELILETIQTSPENNARRILQHLLERGFITPGVSGGNETSPATSLA